LNVVGVVAALAAEARTLGSTVRGGADSAALADGTLVAVSGMGDAAAGRAAERLIEAGATALMSWGMAGGLDPCIGAGAACLPREVLSVDGRRYSVAAFWRDSLAALIATRRPVVCGNLLSVARPVDTVAAKASAFRETGAGAVDMESCAVAQVAEAHGLPFVAVRVIVDTAADAVPRAVASASAAGQVRLGRLFLGLIRAPSDIPPLLRLARRYRVALRALASIGALGNLAPPLPATRPSLKRA
jgi:adenosylhomocysteine nucleosidase